MYALLTSSLLVSWTGLDSSDKLEKWTNMETKCLGMLVGT